MGTWGTGVSLGKAWGPDACTVSLHPAAPLPAAPPVPTPVSGSQLRDTVPPGQAKPSPRSPVRWGWRVTQEKKQIVCVCVCVCWGHSEENYRAWAARGPSQKLTFGADGGVRGRVSVMLWGWLLSQMAMEGLIRGGMVKLGWPQWGQAVGGGKPGPERPRLPLSRMGMRA